MIKIFILLAVICGTLFYSFYVQPIQESQSVAQTQEFLGWMQDTENNSQNLITKLESRMYDEALFSNSTVLENSLQAHIEMFQYLERTQGVFSQDIAKKYQDIFGKAYDNIPTLQEIQQTENEEFEKRRSMYRASQQLHSFYLNNFDLIRQEEGKLIIDNSVYEEYQKLYSDYTNAYIEFEKYRQSLLGGEQLEPQGF